MEQSAEIVLNVIQGQNTASGNCIINGFPAAFAVAFGSQQSNLSGTWRAANKNPRPFSGALSSKGAFQLTVNAATNKHPTCVIDVIGKMSGDATNIAGTFQSSNGCNEQGQGTFQVSRD